MSSLFDSWVKEFGIPASPLIHVGAHLAEERFSYQDLGFLPVYWIEAIPSLAQQSRKLVEIFKDQYVIQALISDSAGLEVDFYLAGPEDSSSSVLKPHLIQTSHPEVRVESVIKLNTKTLDEIYLDGEFGKYEKFILVLDMQGSESSAVLGAKDLIKNVDYIFSEVSIRELYKNGLSFDEYSELLSGLGFNLAAAEINADTGWGEALFSRIHRVEINRKTLVTSSYSKSYGIKIRTFLLRMGFPVSIVRKVSK